MNREDLKIFGLNDEQVEAVIASHGQTVQSLNSQIDTLQQSEKELKSQLSSRDEDLAKLQKDNKDNEALKTQIDTLKMQYEDLEKTSAEKLTKIQRDSALNIVEKEDSQYLFSEFTKMKTNCIHSQEILLQEIQKLTRRE